MDAETRQQLSQMWDLLQAALNIRGDGVTVVATKGPEGMVFSAPVETRYLATITVNYGGGQYAWQSVYQDDYYSPGDSEEIGPYGFGYLGYSIPDTGYFSVQGDNVNGWLAFERNFNDNVPVGAQVWIYPHFFDGGTIGTEWVFDYKTQAIDSDIPWVITTTLNGAITATAVAAVLTSAALFPSLNKYVVQIDSEQILVGAGFGTNNVSSLIRGWNSTIPAAHSNGATVTLVLLGSIPDISRLTASTILEVYPGLTYDEAVIINMTQPVNLTSGPDGSGYFSGSRQQWDPVAQTFGTEEAIYVLNQQIALKIGYHNFKPVYCCCPCSSFEVVTSTPSYVYQGLSWYNSTSKTLNYYNGSTVQTFYTEGGSTGNTTNTLTTALSQTTTAAAVTLINSTTTNSMQGVWTIKNTDLANSLDLLISATDAFGATITNHTITVSQNSNLIIDLNGNFNSLISGTIYPPLTALKIQIQDHSAGMHAAYSFASGILT
jgi:hypothetical protein